LEQLTGEPLSTAEPLPPDAMGVLTAGAGLGHSQFNELLLLQGYDRICADLFQFLVDGTIPYQTGSAMHSLADLERAVERFRTLALLFFGNVKFAFKRLGSMPAEVEQWVGAFAPGAVEGFQKRHRPIQPIEPIAPADTYLLGYMAEAELDARLAADPSDSAALAQQARRVPIVEQGRRNHNAYLVSDHLDVYVATSMREKHEYFAISEFCERLFSSPQLATLQLRWFDPTQAYCSDRIDKGLAEALMLKRARCTLYLIQETDTLGKDSELASTLAQGKPVVAYVPIPAGGFVDRLLTNLRIGTPDTPDEKLMLDQLRIFEPSAAWTDVIVQSWLSDPQRAKVEVEQIKERLASAVTRHYDKRAKTLQEIHPLGIQVNLATGVANGVLVVRREEDCADLISRIVTARLEFDVVDEKRGGIEYVLLRERITKCVFRVMTGDQRLTNAFWNFYLEPAT
jgi:hypothetical protein